MNKNATIRMGDGNHGRCYDMLTDHVGSGTLDPTRTLSQTESITGAIEAFKAFNERQPGWMKIELEPSA
jgi:threonine dehydrogenase-like Zn-dependent dehydrogenase